MSQTADPADATQCLLPAVRRSRQALEEWLAAADQLLADSPLGNVEAAQVA